MPDLDDVTLCIHQETQLCFECIYMYPPAMLHTYRYLLYIARYFLFNKERTLLTCVMEEDGNANAGQLISTVFVDYFSQKGERGSGRRQDQNAWTCEIKGEEQTVLM